MVTTTLTGRAIPLLPQEAKGRSAIRPLKVLLAASLIVPVLLFTLFAWYNYRAAFANAEKELQRASQLAGEHATRILEAQNQVAERVADLVRGMSDDAIKSEQLSLHKSVARIIGQLPDVSSVMIINRAGHPLLSSSLFPVPVRLDFSHDDYFDSAVRGYDGTFIGKMQLGAVSRKPFLPMAHTLKDLDGKSTGVIVVGVQPEVFQRFYSTMLGDEGSQERDVALLTRSGGNVILRYPPFDPALPPVSLGKNFNEATKEHPDHGIYNSPSVPGAGDHDRVFAYERVPHYPLYVVTGRSRVSIVDGWAWFMASHLIFGIPATLMLFLITLIALRRTQQKESALAQAEAEMRRREMAEAALLQRQRLDAIGQMTGGIAHDFNNLLMVIMGNLERLERRTDDAAIRRLASNALLGAKRGTEIIQKLLAFSRKELVHPELVDTNQRLREFKPLIDEAAGGVLVELVLDARSAVARLDQGQFEAAILNLVTNARDAMADEGRIVITTSDVASAAADLGDLPPGDYVRITVSDTGPGMDADTVARAFEPFFTTKEAGKGTGLGLSQVYGFAKRAGGIARILPLPGEGATIELLLPKCNEPAELEQTEFESPSLHAECEGLVILVVEDNPAVRQLTVESLRELGYQTVAVDNARAALEHLGEADRVDFLFSDVVMPGGMNGYQLSVEARKLRPGLKVLLTSGYATAALGGKLPDNVSLLAKPYTQEQLGRQLRAVLREHIEPRLA
jgi:two-component system, NtrC family, sensor kinase